MLERPAAASAAVTLPDRVTVLTCIGCGAMGREERCDGDCCEHKLLLVTAGDYDELEDRIDWASPDTVTGWWCARCDNVGMPQPCIGVCVWRPAAWVNLAVYERQLRLAEPGIRAARSLSGFLARVAAVTPRAGQWRRNWGALQAQALAAVVDFVPDSPAPAAQPRPDPDPVVRV